VEKVSSSFLRWSTAGMSEKLSYLAVTMTAVKSAPQEADRGDLGGVGHPTHGDEDVGPVLVLQGELL
jgi:predicted trehalose synthase